MKIVSISYKTSQWELQNLDLGKVNLVVGKNTTGKSLVLETILMLSQIIKQNKRIDELGNDYMTWSICLQDTSFTLKYEYEWKNAIIFEKITWNGEVTLYRSGEEATITNALTKQQEQSFPPANKLLLHVLRDVKKYPFLEPLVRWSENMHGIRFANIDSQTGHQLSGHPFMGLLADVPTLFKYLPTSNQERVVEHLNLANYPIENITAPFNETQAPILFIKEKGVNNIIKHYDLSQGLIRSLSLFIFLEYVLKHKQAVTLLIDDLCEGLDYDRATKLGKIVFETCEQNDIQLLATSNDSFLMEVVDIKNWNILQRNGQTVTSINNQNNPDLFKEFRFTGMSNFDLLASDFITQKIAKI
ncbi:MAG: ATP-binding protein [Bacteroidetes bacterium]|nr:MAG: ATP-binding protein [Bacteroidota bacterium]